MLSSIIFLLGNEVFSRGTQSSTTQCHSLWERRYQVPAAQRTEMQVSWFVKWFAVFSVFIKITKVSFGKMNHSTFCVWRVRESPSTVKLHVFYFKGTSTTLYTSYSKLHKSPTTFSCHMEPAKKIVWLIWKSFLSYLSSYSFILDIRVIVLCSLSEAAAAMMAHFVQTSFEMCYLLRAWFFYRTIVLMAHLND